MENIDVLLEEIKSEIDRAETSVVSFDIFDTLVLRPALFADDILQLATLIVEHEYSINLLSDRLVAEVELGNPFASLDEIWTHIVKKNHLEASLYKQFANVEQAVELQLLFRRQIGKELYDYAVKAGKHIIAISDMYLSSTVLKKTLFRLGYDKIETVYVSCERKACKRDSSLYAKVIKAERLQNPSQCVHIGDSQRSDCYSPRALGLRAFCLPKNRERFQSQFPDLFLAMEKGSLCERLLFGFATNILIDRDWKAKKDDKGAKYAALLVFPILLSSILFLLQTQEIQKTGVYSALFFLSRDGWLFYRAYELLREYWRADVLEGFYLYGSRIACRCLAESAPEDILKARWIPEGCTLADLIRIVVLNESIRNEALHSIPQEILALDVAKDKELCCCALKEFSCLLKPAHDERVSATKQYYLNAFGSASQVLIMDCGFCGTIAAYLNRGFEGVIRVDKVFLWENEKNKLLDDVFSTTTYTIFDQKNGHGMGPLMEAIFSNLSGSCLGFTKTEDESVRPVFEPAISNEVMARNHSYLQNSALEMVRAFGELFSPYLDILPGMRSKAIMETVQILVTNYLSSPSILDTIFFPEALPSKKEQLSVGEILRNRCELS